MGSLREKYEQRLSELKTERARWEPAWREIAEQFVPYRTVWTAADRNDGLKKDKTIPNNTPVEAINTLVAGMMAGITSPSRQWYSLTASDPAVRDNSEVEMYLMSCRAIIDKELQASNWYSALANGVYMDLGSIGTAAMFAEDNNGRMRFRPMPIGEYFLDVNAEGEVDTCYRELTLNVRQTVAKFGLDVVSERTRSAYNRGSYASDVTIIHAIQPNADYGGGFDKKFKSCWWEVGHENKEAFLREGGYEEFPVLAPRWFVRPGDAYGRGPGWNARGDARMLQYLEDRLMKMNDKIVNPPLRASSGIKRHSLLPGDITTMPRGENAILEPIMSIDPNAMNVLLGHIQRTEERVRRSMFVHLWQNMLSDDRNQRATATEVEARRQEVMLMLGPLLENLNGGLLEPAIERTFSVLERAGRLPEPPEVLAGSSVSIEFVSVMHQMQQATGLLGINTLVQNIGMLAQLQPSVLDKLNSDVLADEIGRITGVRPDAINDEEKTSEIRGARAQQEQAEQMAEQAQPIAGAVKTLSEVDTGGLGQLAQSMAPVVQGMMQ
jgi:hypothetical protein